MAKPHLVIVAGPPASGKTTLTAAIGDATGLPVVSKDTIKEALMDHMGNAPEVGAAAFAAQFAIARELLHARSSLVLEGAFFRDQPEIVELAALAPTIAVELHCDIDVLERRYVDRIGSRHPGHRGLEAVPDLRGRVAKDLYGSPELGGPLLRANTTHGLDPPVEQVVEWVKGRLARTLEA